LSNRTKRKGQGAVAPRPAQGSKGQTQPRQQAAAARPQPATQPVAQPKPRPVVDTAAQAERRTARMERQEMFRAAAEKRRRMKQIRRYGIIGAIVVVLLGTFAALYIAEASKPGESVPLMATQHLGANVASPVEYNSDPPTSGPHYEIAPAFKIYSEPITKEIAVHGLEDGGVIINYRPDLDKPTVDKLAAIATSYIEREGYQNHVLMAPYPDLSHPIVLTAWRRIQRFDALDEAKMRTFIDAYVGWDHHAGREGRRVTDR
jgi:hypothetical protein